MNDSAMTTEEFLRILEGVTDDEEFWETEHLEENDLETFLIMTQLSSVKHRKFGNTDFSDPHILSEQPFHHRRTTLFVTFGFPNITSVEIQTIMETGMNVAKFPASTSTIEDKIILISKVEEAAKGLASKYGMVQWPYAICLELKTCIVRTGILQEGQPVIFKENDTVILTCDKAEYDKCNKHQIYIDNIYMTSEMEVGMEISIRQDAIILQVTEIDETTAYCVVIQGGRLKNMDFVSMRGAKRTRPFLSKIDHSLIKLATEHKVDMIIVNYVRSGHTIQEIKESLGTKANRPFIVSGICSYEGLCNIDQVIKESDGILLPREYLTYELESRMAKAMPRIQMWLTAKCRKAGKPLYISGEILQNTFEKSKIDPRDVSDVTSALLIGVSGFVLQPCNKPHVIRHVINELTAICKEIEPFTNDKVDFRREIEEKDLPINAAMAAVMACAMIANETQARLIVVPTVSGRTVYYLNSLRVVSMILAVTTNVKTFRLLQINRSAYPLLYDGPHESTFQRTVKARLDFAIDHAVNTRALHYGDYYVTLEKGADESSYCDTVRMFKVMTRKKEMVECAEGDNEKTYDTISVKTHISV